MSQNNPLRALLDKQDILLLDGAMATELQARGCNLADSLWHQVLVETRSLSAKCILITTGRGRNARSLPAIRRRRRASPREVWMKRSRKR